MVPYVYEDTAVVALTFAMDAAAPLEIQVLTPNGSTVVLEAMHHKKI